MSSTSLIAAAIVGVALLVGYLGLRWYRRRRGTSARFWTILVRASGAGIAAAQTPPAAWSWMVTIVLLVTALADVRSAARRMHAKEQEWARAVAARHGG